MLKNTLPTLLQFGNSVQLLLLLHLNSLASRPALTKGGGAGAEAAAALGATEHDASAAALLAAEAEDAPAEAYELDAPPPCGSWPNLPARALPSCMAMAGYWLTLPPRALAS